MYSICAYKFIVSKQALHLYCWGEFPDCNPPPQRKNGSDQLPIPFCSSVPECCCIDYFSKEAQAGCLKVCFLREHFWIHNPVDVTWTKMVWAVYQTIFPLNGKLFWHKTLGEWLKYSTHSIWWYLWLLCYNIPVLRQLVKCSGVQCLQMPFPGNWRERNSEAVCSAAWVLITFKTHTHNHTLYPNPPPLFCRSGSALLRLHTFIGSISCTKLGKQ